jgi:hypothetical protein
MPKKGVIGLSGMKPGFQRLKATAGIGNTRNQPIWHLKKPISQPILDVSPIWIPLITDEVTKSKGSP